MIRSISASFCIVVAAFLSGPPRLPAAAPPASPPATSSFIPHKMLSEMPLPKAGTKVKLGRDEVTMQKDEKGLLEVMNVSEGEEKPATLGAASWALDADGWFDSEGFNLTKAYPRSGFWALRSVKGHRRAGGGSGLTRPDSNLSLVPQAPPRLHRAGPGDIVTHIDGIRVTTFERYTYALNHAANPRDIPIIVMNGETGRKHVFYITAHKAE